MADSDTTQQVDVDAIIAKIQLKWDESEARREARREANKKLLAEAIAGHEAKREAKREAHEKLLAEARAIIANGQLKQAEPAKNVLTKTERQRIIIKALFDLQSALPRDPFFEVAKAIAKHADFSRDVEQSSA